MTCLINSGRHAFDYVRIFNVFYNDILENVDKYKLQPLSRFDLFPSDLLHNTHPDASYQNYFYISCFHVVDQRGAANVLTTISITFKL